MPVDRKYQLDDNSRKEYIETRIIPYIPAALKESYAEKIPAIVDMYAGSDAEVISIIEDAIGKDHYTEKCINLEKVLGILVGNSAEKRAIILKECHKTLNINHSAPKREVDTVPAVYHTKNKEIRSDLDKDQIYLILAHYA